AGNFDKAIAALMAAEQVDDRCGVISFLHALAMSRQFEKSLQNEKIVPDLDRSIESLRIASQLLRRAASDPLVAGQSRNLLEVVDSYQAQLLEIARERARVEHDARPINELVKDFNALLDSLEGSVGSIKDVESAEKSLNYLRQ